MKKKPVIITALALYGIVLATWAVLHYKARHEMEEKYQNSLTARFNAAMDIAFPLIDGYAHAMNERADSIEALAQKAKEDKENNFNTAFGRLWEQYIRMPGGRSGSAIMEEFEYFRMSPLFSVLTESGEKKQKETEAIQNITHAGILLLEPYVLQYDSLMNASKEARQYLSESMKVMEPYRGENKDIHAWRNMVSRK